MYHGVSGASVQPLGEPNEGRPSSQCQVRAVSAIRKQDHDVTHGIGTRCRVTHQAIGRRGYPEGGLQSDHAIRYPLRAMSEQLPQVSQRCHVFISYARSTSQDAAEALKVDLEAKLGSGTVFLDTRNVSLDGQFPDVLRDALLSSRVVVVFPRDPYFSSHWCMKEWKFALSPYSLASLPDDDHRDAALAHIVLAWDASISQETASLFPPRLQTRFHATAGTGDLVDTTLNALCRCPDSIEQRLDAAGLRRTALLAYEGGHAMPTARVSAGAVEWSEQVLPSINDAFVGRAELLWQIHVALVGHGDPGNVSPSSACIWGGTGYGKTRVALEYWHRFGASHFSGGRFWIDASQSREGLEWQQRQVLRALGESGEVDAVSLTPSLARRLAAVARDRRVLVVLDNLPEEAPLDRRGKPLQLSFFMPQPNSITLLATSTKRWLGFNHTIELEVLAADAATSLLTRGVSRRNDLTDAEWHEVAGTLLGGLPLALDLLNVALCHHALRPAEMIEALRGARTVAALDDQYSILAAEVGGNTLRAVGAAFAMSFDRLPPPARRAAATVAWFAPAALPERLLDGILAQESASTPDAQSLRSILRTRSFVGGDDVSGRWSMHRLLAGFLRSVCTHPMAADVGDRVRGVGSAIRALLAAMPAVSETILARDWVSDGWGPCCTTVIANLHTHQVTRQVLPAEVLEGLLALADTANSRAAISGDTPCVLAGVAMLRDLAAVAGEGGHTDIMRLLLGLAAAREADCVMYAAESEALEKLSRTMLESLNVPRSNASIDLLNAQIALSWSNCVLLSCLRDESPQWTSACDDAVSQLRAAVASFEFHGCDGRAAGARSLLGLALKAKWECGAPGSDWTESERLLTEVLSRWKHLQNPRETARAEHNLANLMRARAEGAENAQERRTLLDSAKARIESASRCRTSTWSPQDAFETDLVKAQIEWELALLDDSPRAARGALARMLRAAHFAKSQRLHGWGALLEKCAEMARGGDSHGLAGWRGRCRSALYYERALPWAVQTQRAETVLQTFLRFIENAALCRCEVRCEAACGRGIEWWRALCERIHPEDCRLDCLRVLHELERTVGLGGVVDLAGIASALEQGDSDPAADEDLPQAATDDLSDEGTL